MRRIPIFPYLFPFKKALKKDRNPLRKLEIEG